MDFHEKAQGDEKAICLMVAPEMIFTPAEETNRGLYTAVEHTCLVNMLNNLRNRLDDRVLIIAGTIQYLIDGHDQYVNRSYIVSSESLNFYDKKANTGDIHIQDNNCKMRAINMQAGKSTGLILFKGIRIGLEICLDHEEKTLLRELQGQKPVDIQVLICAGQSIRKESLATSKNKPGLFIVCELTPEVTTNYISFNKTYEKTACYNIRILGNKQSNERAAGDRYRSSYVVLMNSILMDLEMIEGITLNSSIQCSVTVLPVSLEYTHAHMTMPDRFNHNSNRTIANSNLFITNANYTINNQVKKLNFFNVLDVLFKSMFEALENTNIKMPNEMARIARLICNRTGYKLYENQALVKIEKLANRMTITYMGGDKGNELYAEFYLRLLNTVCAYKNCLERDGAGSIDQYHDQLAHLTSVLNKMHDNILNIKYSLTQKQLNKSLNNDMENATLSLANGRDDFLRSCIALP